MRTAPVPAGAVQCPPMKEADVNSVPHTCPITMDYGPCGRKVYAYGMCSAHYQRRRKNQDLTKPFHTQPSPESAFWVHARPGAEPEDCWGWNGMHDWLGYGIFSWRSTYYRGNVFACALLNGPRPDEKHALHKCGPNPGCVNPNHLAWGTPKENMNDSILDGTRPRGTSHERAKLSEQDVLAIYHSPEPHRVLARRYGVGSSTVWAIKSGKSWAWLTGVGTGL